MEIYHLDALSDNYMYVLVDKVSKECAVIDPVNSKKIYEYTKNNDYNVRYVLTTHHHHDHAGGNENFKQLMKNNVEIIGGDDRVDGLTKKVVDGDKIKLGDNVEIECLHTPCHTRGHICYLVKNSIDSDTAVFTGDTMFIAGCGRFFEGTSQEMYKALIDKLGQLPHNTLVYCGHEYTVKNLQFALTIEPNNEDVIKKLNWAIKEREANRATIPSTIGEEWKTNPFMRIREQTVKETVSNTTDTDPIFIMAQLRRRKDNF